MEVCVCRCVWMESEVAMDGGLATGCSLAWRHCYSHIWSLQDGVSNLNFLDHMSFLVVKNIWNKGGMSKITIAGKLFRLVSHRVLIKDTFGYQEPASGYCSVSNPGLQPASYPGLSYCQEETKTRRKEYWLSQRGRTDAKVIPQHVLTLNIIAH